MSVSELLKPYERIPEAVLSPNGRAVALQCDIARAFGVADATIVNICKHQRVRKFAGKFLDIQDVSLALANRNNVGRPRKESK
jgi:hypothetical protein